ncbi:hypothetical protein FORMB_22910 [Formosa sp. Hel1_33_131]|uniref:hypothetical protein n=1 Tax=Formosa sp. Hel1_33_131 TaxID=1336794 RepID=UPI00084E3566|nr:hypothetical protein [Formosa sp. Hel1_33_131]AOR29309.1 hypothetical protein FORMB_22910 [Formosa sp. Hel1_33_131]
MKTRLIILAFLFTQVFYSQIKIQEDNLTIEYEKTKKASQLIAVTNVRTKSKKIVQYNIKVRIEMIDNKKRSFDPNKFSLIDYQNKIRLRPVDVAYTNFTDKWHFYKLIKNKPSYKSLENRYDPSIKDTFLDYEFEGITNYIIPIHFEAYNKYKISFKNPKKVPHETYFEPKELRKRNINLYFPLIKGTKSATLYYGNTKIEDIKFK